MTHPVYNFNAGPAALPGPVLAQAQHELHDYAGTGISILETSHRSAVYQRVHQEALTGLRTLLHCPEEYAILFMGGGAQTQFDLVPLNLLPSQGYAAYLVTDVWSHMALSAARQVGEARELWSGEAQGYTCLPDLCRLRVPPDAAYVHYTSNNTAAGTQFQDIPETGAVPLICDMTSDLGTRPLDVSRFGLIYASAQKNLGVAGVTVLLVHPAVLERAGFPAAMLNYSQIAAYNSLLNTPPVFAIYLLSLVVKHWLAQGGLPALAALNQAKATLLYEALDRSDGFYRGRVAPACRSQLNVTFHLPTPALEACFVAESTAAGLLGLEGHRSVGGLRASLYNAVPLQAVQDLVAFMQAFQERHGA